MIVLFRAIYGSVSGCVSTSSGYMRHSKKAKALQLALCEGGSWLFFRECLSKIPTSLPDREGLSVESVFHVFEVKSELGQD